MGAVYQVGDAAGWNAQGTDYKAWASNINFQLGDTIVFNYNPQMHNALEVSSADFKACSGAAPTVAYTSGNDQVVLSTPGEHYFICSFPGMCQAGQKVKIKVSSSSSDNNNHSPPSPVVVPKPPIAGTNMPRVYPIGCSASSPLVSFHNKLGLIALFTSCVFFAFYIH
ncbi:hypothetical protein RD792_009677 [Penstemon davidsonii]|uniref:Phytocyanin domain-containing protein n=1 Tax=Penstemon davidsonii TaxID=160366 RepID=A0ABR0D157_9LAMI|nr:hypothetical protein RD792_009677 [Penstemon davidsonii]